MPYDPARHKELTDKLNAGLAKAAGPRLVHADTDTSEEAFEDILFRVNDIIDFRLKYGHNSAEIEMPLDTAHIFAAGRVIEALEDQGFSATVYARPNCERPVLIFEAILLPFGGVEAAVPMAETLEVQAALDHSRIDLPGGGFCSIVSPDGTPRTDTDTDTDSVSRAKVYLFSQKQSSVKALAARACLQAAGYEVTHVSTPLSEPYPHTELRCSLGSPEEGRIERILRGLVSDDVRIKHYGEDWTPRDPSVYFVDVND